ncbi:MAG TPA: PIN/TRAM domain-containing protein [Bacillota bacterium]|nr:PIN/TRAM domain-containing protein [Bacillota bacterium]HPZ11317.1 PIN/TRAM domain-containing protein [Bacillota bacterium]HQE09458.1 PIN/TRAM domain-containing protein [Bacillota bacterium]
MVRKVLRIMGTLLGIVAGVLIFYYTVPRVVTVIGGPVISFSPWSYSAAGGALFGLLFYFITPSFISICRRFLDWCENRLKKVPTQDIFLVVVSMIITLFLGLLISYPIYNIPHVGVYIAPIIILMIVYIGVRIILNRKDDFAFLTSFFNRNSRVPAAADNETFKILDTSAIIDGRIVDICKTGFLEGVIVVAGFVLEELRHIADSPDMLKRNRGRRGLDILNKIQKEMDIPVQIYEGDFEELGEVDSKLVRLAKVLNGKIITNDFNLNKVCELQGISVLNINELANAVKPVVLPGEEMTAQIIKDGKEVGQGVAYLEDGTMVVVEGGKRHIGETIEVLVTSVLQTAAGRMIFAKPKNTAEKVSGAK